MLSILKNYPLKIISSSKNSLSSRDWRSFIKTLSQLSIKWQSEILLLKISIKNRFHLPNLCKKMSQKVLKTKAVKFIKIQLQTYNIPSVLIHRWRESLNKIIWIFHKQCSNYKWLTICQQNNLKHQFFITIPIKLYKMVRVLQKIRIMYKDNLFLLKLLRKKIEIWSQIFFQIIMELFP